MQILLDGGSSDSFLHPRIEHFLKLPIEPAPQFNVLVGNGNTMTSEGCIQDLQVMVQGHKLQLSAFLLLVAGVDLILGASWLATLGPHVADYSSLTLKFYLNGQFITLHGDKTAMPMQAQFHHLKRMHYMNAIAKFFTLQVQHQDNPQDQFLELPSNLKLEVALLLHNYRVVFDKPTGLPPAREQIHAIKLMEGSNPVKVKPYQYTLSENTD